MPLRDTTIAFIGAGNMASALVKGLVATGVPAGNILVNDLQSGRADALARECGVRSGSNEELARSADVVVLAVKPQGMRAVVEEIAPALAGRDSLLVSVAAGVTLDSLAAWAGASQAIVRCMPNTPALVRAGATALFANARVREEQRRVAEDVLRAVGSVCWLESEEQMDAVTALSGSGPAYFFLLMEALQEAGIALGLPAETAARLCRQTAHGAALLALEAEVGVDELRRRVTSPGGTTEAALRQFADEGFKDTVRRALEKAAARSRELAAGN